MTERRERIKIVFEWLKKNHIFKSNRAIAEIMGYNPCVLSQVISGKINISSNFVNALCNTYPGLRYDWIWEGKGEMLSSLDETDLTKEVPNGSLDRYTFVLFEVVKTMRQVSLLIQPMNNEINQLKANIIDLQKKIQALESKLIK